MEKVLVIDEGKRKMQIGKSDGCRKKEKGKWKMKK